MKSRYHGNRDYVKMDILSRNFICKVIEFKKCLDLCACLDLSNPVKLSIYDKYMILAYYNKILILGISVTSFLVSPIEF